MRVSFLRGTLDIIKRPVRRFPAKPLQSPIKQTGRIKRMDTRPDLS